MKQSTILNLLRAYINQTIDYDKKYGHQCVDLVYKVLRDHYGMQNWLNLRNGAAKDMALPEAYRQFASQLEFIPNTPEFIPQIGDICVTQGGQYNSRFGHVFLILDNSNINQMHTLEQNVGNGDGQGYDDRTIENWRNYKNILTFVRWKGIEQTINYNEDMEIKNKLKESILKDTRYDELTRVKLLEAVSNNDMDYVLAFSGAVIRDENKELQNQLEQANKALHTKENTLELPNGNFTETNNVTSIPPFRIELTEDQTKKLNEQEVKQLIKETARRFNLNDWAMGWVTFGIDKWSIFSALIASVAYYMQNSVDPQYHPLIAYVAVGWSTLILVFFLYNKAKK